ncbi:atp-dependent dna helicase pif1 [Lasius niger]|uniref:ATP-dependent DNA helicase n=1 Tax=Lasius niger TaxID=67767 RepID=A0A0J7K021_LASNI|nr:atp-dependent dna helicase pif1 [Lasius niger]
MHMQKKRSDPVYREESNRKRRERRRLKKKIETSRVTTERSERSRQSLPPDPRELSDPSVVSSSKRETAFLKSLEERFVRVSGEDTYSSTSFPDWYLKISKEEIDPDRFSKSVAALDPFLFSSRSFSVTTTRTWCRARIGSLAVCAVRILRLEPRRLVGLKTPRPPCGPTVNRQQLRVLLALYRHMKTKTGSEPPIYYFVRGMAGTGKTFLISLMERLVLRISPQGRGATVAKLGSTGKSAHNIGGRTVHSALGLHPDGLERPLPPRRLESFRRRFRDCRLVIVDEVSMVGARLFRAMDQRLRQITGNGKLRFGGLNVVLVGDPYQLRPVRDTPAVFDDGRARTFELTTSMRQSKDPRFEVLLKNMARGETTREDLELLLTRRRCVVSRPEEIVQLDATTVMFATNRECDEYNRARLDGMDGRTYHSIAVDRVVIGRRRGSGRIDEEGVGVVVEETDRRSRVENLAYDVPLKIGGRYMALHNVDPKGGIVNGAIGILKEVEFYGGSGNNNNVKSVLLSIGRIDRIQRVSRIATRYQLPITPAFAITVHKSQGSTFDRAAIGISQRMNREMMYVACSRVRRIKDLYVILPPAPSLTRDISFFLDSIQVPPKIQQIHSSRRV